SPEVDSTNLNLGLSARATAPALALPPAAATQAKAPDGAAPAGEPVERLRQALAREVAAALASGPDLVPLGKWLSEDLVLAAERLSGGRSRRAASLLGLPESTYRRQLRTAGDRRASGHAQRSASWSSVAAVLEDFIKSRRGDADVCQWAEATLLAEVDKVVSDARKAAALLGVTEPTLLRQKTQTISHY